MKRREFLKYGSYGFAAVALGPSLVFPPRLWGEETAVPAQDGVVELVMQEVMAEMVDKRKVYMWAFGSMALGPRIPGPVLFAEEGDPLVIKISNAMDAPHAFAIPGVIESPPMEPGATLTLNLMAPKAGTYLYLDPLNAPVNRVMGLHGSLVVLPKTGITPYSDPTTAVERLFDALGDKGTTPEIFPGDPWDRTRSWVWLFNTVDPSKNHLVEKLPAGAVLPAKKFVDGYLPTYFTLTGKSGFFSSHDPAITPHGNVGQPALIRCLNAGMATHSPHIHGTHVFAISHNSKVSDNPFLLDTWTLKPMDTKDVLHPFIQPPDAYPWPPSNIREFPMPFTMHCHTEMSQTAAGGNYPQGSVTDWDLTSPQVGGPEASHEEFPPFRGMDSSIFKKG